MIMENANSLDKFIATLDTDDAKKNQIKKRILAFQEIDKQLAELKPLLRNAQKETLAYYKKNPKNAYQIVTPTDLILDYIKDIKEILNP